uniref:Protein UNC80 C-terminal domain-containing protein n=1 Tax=Romanomermis culicivorax TaxID=13658 RepID=A0A915IV74_ROMCU
MKKPRYVDHPDISTNVIMQAVIPHYMKKVQDETKKCPSSSSMPALKHELHTLTTLMVQVKTLISCCDVLS